VTFVVPEKYRSEQHMKTKYLKDEKRAAGVFEIRVIEVL
jgi:hypothetical protein